MNSTKKQQDQTSYTPNPATLARFNPTFDAASQLINRPTQAYTGQMAPGLDPLQQQAMGAAQANQGVGSGAVQQGINTAGGVAGYQPQQVQAGMLGGMDLSKYMDPYVSNVVGQTNQGIDLNRQRAVNDQSGQFTQAGAWGGSRHGVADALTNEAALRQTAQTDAGLYSQGYGQAVNSATSDLNRGLSADQSNQSAGLQGQGLNLSASGMLGNLGSTLNGLGVTDANQLAQMGTMGQATQGNQDQAAYQEWLRQQQDPLTKGGMLGGLLGSMGQMYAGATTNQQGKSSSSDPLGWAKFLWGGG